MLQKINIVKNELTKSQITVLKRKATILKKREMKQEKKNIYQSKQILKAGIAFTNEKDKVSDKFKIKDENIKKLNEDNENVKHTKNFIATLKKQRRNINVKVNDSYKKMNEQIKKAITSDSKFAKTMKSLIRGVTNKEKTRIN